MNNRHLAARQRLMDNLIQQQEYHITVLTNIQVNAACKLAQALSAQAYVHAAWVTHTAQSASAD